MSQKIGKFKGLLIKFVEWYYAPLIIGVTGGFALFYFLDNLGR